jgi:hypothetical protein
MNIKNTLERFDEKFTTEFNGKRILYYDYEKDENLIEVEEIKQFIKEEIETAYNQGYADGATGREKAESKSL